MIPDYRGASNTGLRSQQTITPKPDVVRNLHKTVNFTAISDFRRMQNPRSNHRVRSNETVVSNAHSSQMRHEFQFTLRLHETKTCAADDSPGLNHTIFPDNTVLLYHRIQFDACPIPYKRRILLNM